MMTNVRCLPIQFPHELVQHWGWFLAFGIGLLLLGVAAVARSVTGTSSSMSFFGWLLLLSAGIEIAQAVMVGQWSGFFLHLMAGILFAAMGVLLVTRLVTGAEVLTIVIAMLFVIGGLFQLSASWAAALPGWGWQMANGIITFVLGLLLLAQWPASGLWAIGLFIGTNLICFGSTWTALAFHLRAG